MKGILNLIITQWRGIYTRKSNQNIIFFNAWILPTCSFTVTVYFNLGLLVFLCMLDCCIFMYRICWIAGIFTCQIAGIFRYVRPYDSESGWTICSPAAKCAGNNYRDSRGEARVWQITGKCRYDGKTLSSQILATLLCL